MELLLLISIFIFSLTSCDFGKSDNFILTKLFKDSGKVEVSNKFKSNNSIVHNDNKNTTDIEYITVGSLDISKYDLGIFDTKQADLECGKLGGGWRLPNETELNIIFEKSEDLEPFESNYYLGKDYQPSDNENEIIEIFMRKSITNGEFIILQSNEELFSIYGVRAVRPHKLEGLYKPSNLLKIN